MRLKELREEKNLTQNDIAKAINTSRPNIGRWEKGENEPSSSAVIALAQFFNVSADYLLGLEDDFGIKKSAVAPAPAFTREEMDLVFKYRELPEQLKAIVKQQLDVFSTPETLFDNTEKTR